MSTSLLLYHILLKTNNLIDITAIAPNGSRLSRLAGCALVVSVYNKHHRRRHAPYHLAEGQVG
jgi:hypothetical protein